MDGLYDVRLCIAYEGDTAQLYLNGELLSDHFHNGESWEIGLRELSPRCLGKQLVLHIVPQKTGVKVVRDAMAAITETVTGLHARLLSVKVKPVSVKTITWKGEK